MAKYLIWCRSDEVGTGQYLAVVTAIPEGIVPTGSTSRMESESRLFPTRGLAEEASDRMATAMAERIRQRGDTVSGVERV